MSEGTQDRTLSYDLSEPPTREDFGFETGDRSIGLERGAGDDLMEVSVTLPGGVQFETGDVFRVDSLAFTAESPPESLGVYATFPNPQAGVDALEESGGVLGLDVDTIDRGIQVLTTDPGASSGAIDMHAPDQEYLKVDVSARRDSGAEQVTLVYTFFWAETARSATPTG